MKQHSIAGAQFASALKASEHVDQVIYGFSHGHSAQKFFPEGFGGMVSVRFAKSIDVKKLMGQMRLVTNVPSLGGTESTATMPAFTTNWFMTAEQKKNHGIDEQLVRFSIGLESPEDVIIDVLNAAAESQRG